MANQNELAVLVHAALQRAGFHYQTRPVDVGYGVAALKTGEVQVLHEPSSDDPPGFAHAYYTALMADPILVGLDIQYQERPYPCVLIRG